MNTWHWVRKDEELIDRMIGGNYAPGELVGILVSNPAPRPKKRHRLTERQAMAALACAAIAAVATLLTLDKPDPKTWEGFENPIEAALTFLSCPMFDFYVTMALQGQNGVPADQLAIRIVRLRYPDAEVITMGEGWRMTVRKFILHTALKETP